MALQALYKSDEAHVLHLLNIIHEGQCGWVFALPGPHWQDLHRRDSLGKRRVAVVYIGFVLFQSSVRSSSNAARNIRRRHKAAEALKNGRVNPEFQQRYNRSSPVSLKGMLSRMCLHQAIDHSL